jgi:hypothetical protein
MSNQQRLFTFGCSYTRFIWPTWADWLSTEFQFFQNAAKEGYGNRAIFNVLMEIIYKNSICSNDTVVIAWSTPIREDRWLSRSDQKGWVNVGNIYNQHFYPDEWVEKYFDPFMGLMETFNYTHAALHVLNNIGCKYVMTWVMNPCKLSSHAVRVRDKKVKTVSNICDPENKLVSYYENLCQHENMLQSDIDTYCVNFDYTNNIPNIFMGEIEELHPKPLASYNYVKDVLCPKLGINNFDKNGENMKLAYLWNEYLYDNPRKKQEPSWTSMGKGIFNTF